MLTTVFVLESRFLVEFISSAPDTIQDEADMLTYPGVWLVHKVLAGLILSQYCVFYYNHCSFPFLVYTVLQKSPFWFSQ